jgi:D-glycero-alpha-D-manno-heptose-7-phosphate kinase
VIETRACCRVDLAGGTLDIWPLGLIVPGAVTVNLAIDVEVTVRLEESGPSGHPKRGYRVEQGDEVLEAATAGELRAHPGGGLVGLVAEHLELPPVHLVLRSDSPRGGGLGASSALTVALIAAAEEWLGRPTDAPRRARLARDLEARLMSLPTGFQDHYPALLGGALEIRHRPGGEQVERLDLDPEGLGATFQLFFTGVSHFSAGSNWKVLRRAFEGEAEVLDLFAGIAEAGRDVAAALRQRDYERVGRAVGREWSHRRRLAAEVTTPAIDAAFEAARDAGAWGGKACGAGGGGSIVVFGPTERAAAIRDALTGLGMRPLAARPSLEGLRVRRSG